MASIGGYFGLELRNGEHFHNNAIRLNSARNCLEYILLVRKYKKVYIPYFTCEVILEPFYKLNIQYEFYNINQNLEPEKFVRLESNEAILYTNYFGLKQDCVENMYKYYGKQLIVDNAQAFYSNPIEGVDTFYSPRKFFGVADGGYLYIDKKLDIDLEQDYSYERMSHLLKRIDVSAEFGYNDFQINDASLKNNSIKKMSAITEKILCSIDYDEVSEIRKNNFNYLHENLKNKNLLKFEFDNSTVPMVYPLLIENGSELKKKLISNKIFVATYWQNVLDWTQPDSFESNLTSNLLNLPIDHRNTCEILFDKLNLLIS